MRQAVLIGNVAAGRAWRLKAALPELQRLLRAHGYGSEALQTTAEPGSAGQLAADAVRRGARLVLSCGGDGTVHGVLQGMAQREATLGVLPFGTANALARNLGLPMEPVAALRMLLSHSGDAKERRRGKETRFYKEARIPLGLATFGEGPEARDRWFAVLAGCGPDGMLVEAAHAGAKARFGRSAYYARALRLFGTRRFARFNVRYRLADTDRWQTDTAAGMLVARVADLGGAFSGLTPGARLDDPHLRAFLLRAPAHLSLPAWFVAGRLGLAPWRRLLREETMEEIVCTPLPGGDAPRAQVDGEPAGPIPLRLRVVQDALTLLVPA